MEKNEPICEFGISKLYRNHEAKTWIITGIERYPLRNAQRKAEKEIDDTALLNIILKNSEKPREIFEKIKPFLETELIRRFERSGLSQFEELETLEVNRLIYKISLRKQKVLTWTRKNFGFIVGECDWVELKKDKLIKLIDDKYPDSLPLLIPFLEEPLLKKLKRLIQKNNKEKIININQQEQYDIQKLDNELARRKTIKKEECINKILENADMYGTMQSEPINVDTSHILRFIIGDVGSSEWTNLEFGGNADMGYMLVQVGESEDFGEMRFTDVFEDFRDSISAIYDRLDNLSDFKEALLNIKKIISTQDEQLLIDELLACLE